MTNDIEVRLLSISSTSVSYYTAFRRGEVADMSRETLNLSEMTKEQLQEFRDKYCLFIFDKNGTLTTFLDQPLEGTQAAITEIVKSGKSIKVLTDNCLSSRKEISSGIHRIFPEISKEDVMNCGYLLGMYLKEMNFSKKIYVLSIENSIDKDLKDFGFNVIQDREVYKMTIEKIKDIKLDTDVGSVIVASDINFNYSKLMKAVKYLSNPEVLLFQSNCSNTVTADLTVPGVGALVSSIKAASGRNNSICTGKGGEVSTNYLKSLGYPMDKCLYIGDELSTDIHTGNLAGMDTLLVLSGASSLEDVETAKKRNQDTYIPTYYTNSVADLYRVFRQQA